MTTIAQAYLHTRKSGTEAELAEWGRHAEAIAYEIASSTFPMEVELEIAFQAGSLISRALVNSIGAGLFAAYGAIAIYPDFKDGLREAIIDAREFAESFNKRFMLEADIPLKDIVARQRRIETPGRIYRALDRLEKLGQSTATSGSSRYRQDLHEVVSQLRRGLADLEFPDREQAIRLIAQYHEPRLPEPLLPQLMRPVSWRREDVYPELLGSTEGRSETKFLARIRTDEPLRNQLFLRSDSIERGDPDQ